MGFTTPTDFLISACHQEESSRSADSAFASGTEAAGTHPGEF